MARPVDNWLFSSTIEMQFSGEVPEMADWARLLSECWG